MSVRVPGGYNPASVAITGGNSWFVPSGGSSGAGVSAPADTTEDTLATITLPALSGTAAIRVYTLWTMTSSANNKTLRVRLGGASGTVYFTSVLTATATFSDTRTILLRGATNSQVGENSGSAAFGVNSNPTTTSALDMSVSTTLVITGQKASGAETLTLEGYLIELLKP